MTSPNPKNARKNPGRPRKELTERRTYPVKVYFDQDSYRKLERRSKRTGASLSSIVYDLAVNGCVKEAIPREVLHTLRQIAGMANNLNQLAHEAHVFGYQRTAERTSQIADRVDSLLVSLNK